MIRDFEEFTGVDIFGTPYEILRGVYDETKGFVAGYITLRTPQDFLKYKMMFRKDLVIIVSNLHKDFQKFAEGISALFKGTVVDFSSGVTIYGQEKVNYLLFEQEYADDIYLMYTKYKMKGNAVVFKYARDGFYHNDILQKPQDLARMAQGKQVPVVVCPKLLVSNMAAKYGMIAERLATEGNYHTVESKEYLIGTLDAVPEDKADQTCKVLPADKTNYYGEGTFLPDIKHGTQAETEPIELKGIQLISQQEFMKMDTEGIYETVPRIGEFPNDEVGATWFYVNKKADSFVEIYTTQSDRVYVIKAMDAVFFSKVALALSKQKDIKLELLVRDIAVLATFLLKFGHKQMSFDMEALPDKAVEVRLNIDNSWVGQAKHIVRNLTKGEDGYGKAKGEQLQKLKQKKKPILTQTSVTKNGGKELLVTKTAYGVKRFSEQTKDTLISMLLGMAAGSVQEFVTNMQSDLLKGIMSELDKNGLMTSIEQVGGKYVYSVGKPDDTERKEPVSSTAKPSSPLDQTRYDDDKYKSADDDDEPFAESCAIDYEPTNFQDEQNEDFIYTAPANYDEILDNFGDDTGGKSYEVSRIKGMSFDIESGSGDDAKKKGK